MPINISKVKLELKNAVAESLSSSFNANVGLDDVAIERPVRSGYGDLTTNAAMVFSKKLGVGAQEIASGVSRSLSQKQDLPFIKEVKAVGGFINFFLSDEYFENVLRSVIKLGGKYGGSDELKGKVLLVEHTSPNPNKAMHLGHLRNNVLGMAVSNIFSFLGAEVVRAGINNNRGIAITKLMWGYLKFARKKGAPVDIDYWYSHKDAWYTPSEKNVRPDRFVDDLYVKGSADFEKDKNVEKFVRNMLVLWEKNDVKVRSLWQTVLSYSYEGQKATLDRLGSKWDKVWNEHEIYEIGKALVEEGIKKGIFRVLEDGAVLTDLKSYGLTNTIVRKSDGTSLYITQDIALTKLKKDEFNPDKMYWVVGPEQTLALKQLFAVCDQLGIGNMSDYVHIAYGWMGIKGMGSMSSRKGNVTYIDDLLDKAKDMIKERFEESGAGHKPDADDNCEKIGLGAVKYSILKVSRMTGIEFDFETSLSFEGNSGPYLVYTYARARSILRKSGEAGGLDPLRLGTEKEKEILRLIERFPEVLSDAGLSYSPNLICEYSYRLAQAFNTFYQSVPVLNAEDKSVRASRVALVKAVSTVLKSCLDLLGVGTVERM